MSLMVGQMTVCVAYTGM